MEFQRRRILAFHKWSETCQIEGKQNIRTEKNRLVSEVFNLDKKTTLSTFHKQSARQQNDLINLK